MRAQTQRETHTGINIKMAGKESNFTLPPSKDDDPLMIDADLCLNCNDFDMDWILKTWQPFSLRVKYSFLGKIHYIFTKQAGRGDLICKIKMKNSRRLK